MNPESEFPFGLKDPLKIVAGFRLSLYLEGTADQRRDLINFLRAADGSEIARIFRTYVGQLEFATQANNIKSCSRELMLTRGLRTSDQIMAIITLLVDKTNAQLNNLDLNDKSFSLLIDELFRFDEVKPGHDPGQILVKGLDLIPIITMG